MMSLSALFRQLCRDDRGSMVVWTTVGLVSIFAMGALLTDGARMFNLHTQMQSYADHVALAAAAELDGASDSIERAIRAATGAAGGVTAGPIVTDKQSYSSQNQTLTVSKMVFMSKLASGQGRPGQGVVGDVKEYTWPPAEGGPALTAKQSIASRYVTVTVEPRTLDFVMAPLLASLNIAQAAASTPVNTAATAGFTRTACKFPPMMMCNPNEVNAGDPFDWEATVGKQVLLRNKGPGAAWGPGDFGFLRLQDLVSSTCTGGGAAFLRCLLARIDPGTQCVEQGATVNMEPGQMTGPVHTGMNIRFDTWDAPLQSEKNNPLYAPARNVIRGVTHDANKCDSKGLTDSPTSVPLPRDKGLGTDNRVGNGPKLEQLTTYWSTNHPDIAWPFSEGVTPTRYDIYRKEIELGNSPLGESMAPTCAAAPVTEPSPMDPVKDRRVIVVAVINCKAQDIHGADTGVPVENFALMFLTEPIGLMSVPESSLVPVTGGDPEDVYAEMIGIVKANQENGVLHEFPVLYR